MSYNRSFLAVRSCAQIASAVVDETSYSDHYSFILLSSSVLKRTYLDDCVFALQTSTPLDEAVRFLKPLQLLASDRMDTHVMAFEIYFRKDKLLLMLQSLKRGHLLDPHHHALHECRVKFLKLGNDNDCFDWEVEPRVIFPLL